MIRIKDKTQPVEIYINCLDGYNPIAEFKLIGMGGEEHIYTDLETSFEYNFYKITFDASKLEDGEYEYIVNNYDKGLILIGNLTPSSVQPDMKQKYVADDDLTENHGPVYVAFD